MTEQLTEAQEKLLRIVQEHRYVTETTLASIRGRGWQNTLWSCVKRGWIECMGFIDDRSHYVRVFRLTCKGRQVLRRIGDA